MTADIIIARPDTVVVSERYASLSGRALHLLNSWTELHESVVLANVASATLFARLEELTLVNLWLLHRWALGGKLLGIVPSTVANEDPDATNLADRLWHAFEHPKHRSSLSFVFGGHEGGETERAREQIHNAASGSECVVLSAHGNGYDFRVGRDALCVLANGTQTSSPDPIRIGGGNYRTLPCHLNGRCIRESRGIERFVGPDVLRGRIHVLMTCYGFLPADGLLDPLFSWTVRVIENGAAAAVVTPFGLSFQRLEHALFAAKSTLAGHSAGQLVHELNGLSPAAVPYICIGDPLASVEPSMRADVQFDTPPTTTPTKSGNSVTRFDYADSRSTSWLGLLDRHLQDRLKALGASDQIAPDRDSARWRCDSMAYINSRSAFLQLFLEPFVYGMTEPISVHGDHGCGAALLKFEYQVATVPESVARNTRDVWLCSRCGVVADVPSGFKCPSLCIDEQGVVMLSLQKEMSGPSGWISVTREPSGHNVADHVMSRFVSTIMGTHRLSLDLSGASCGFTWISAAVSWHNDIATLRSSIHVPADQRSHADLLCR